MKECDCWWHEILFTTAIKIVFLGLKQNTNVLPKITLWYCRVSSYKQKDDLARQIESVLTYMLAPGYQFEVITDIGSCINYENKGLFKR